MMKCHYEVLNVPRDAEDTEIKTAYKKLALKWHPDKNLDNPEEAKEQFQLVQQAYEILMDKQERAWYDNHREQILRGSNSEFEDKSLNVFQYFTTTCFKGYGDDENGFYAIYRKVFDQLIEEDMEHIEDKEELDEFPRFGDSTSDYDEVVGPFYAYWMGYSTKKSYVWLDPYNIKETRDRRVLKLIEKENKKVRLKAKKERNEEVRNLVAFVRKRDKRVIANAKKLEAKIAENRKKQEEISKQKRLQRVQEHTASQQAEWTKFDNVKSGLEEIEKNLAEQFGDDLSDTYNDEEEDPDSLYCIACNKMFKTPKSFQNHETSKRHKENVELLKKTLLVEEYNSESDEQEETNSEINDIQDTTVDHENISQSDSDLDTKKDKKNKKKNKKSKNVLRTKTVSETFSEGDSTLPNVLENKNDSDEDFSTSKNKKRKSKKTNSKGKQSTTNQEVDKSEEIQTKDDAVAENSDINRNCSGVENGDKPVDSRSKSKNKNKKNKKQIDAEELEDLDTNHYCAYCKANFPSKNKLFDHLKTTGHSVYLPNNEKHNVKNKKKLREK